MRQVTPEEVAWAAGLFEGEGCISTYQREFGAKIQPQLRLAMTDGDVVHRFHQIVGCGAVGKRHGPVQRERGDKPLYEWRVYEAEKVRNTIALLLPFLGARRRAKALDTLDRIAAVKSHNATKTHCPKGHALAGDNLILEPIRDGKYMARRCKTCRQKQSRDRARKRLGIKPENYRKGTDA